MMRTGPDRAYYLRNAQTVTPTPKPSSPRRRIDVLLALL
jgi:hypothetical protein